MKKKIILSLISLMTIAAMLLGKDVFSRCLFTEEDKEQAFCDTNLVSSSVPSTPARDGSELIPQNDVPIGGSIGGPIGGPIGGAIGGAIGTTHIISTHAKERERDREGE